MDTKIDSSKEGMLYLCATPIGNLDDITVRVLKTLQSCDLIAAEDTRNTMKLLNHYEIKKPLTSYHEHNKYEKAQELISYMKQGNWIALVTDAGTPAISDPGEILVRECLKQGVKVTSLPGACALITALTVSGMPARRFCFEGFLPSEKKERSHVLTQLKQEERTMILYEAPHRLVATLNDLTCVLGNRNIVLCRELTKKYEEVLPMTLDEAIAMYEKEEPRGEYVIVIEGRDPLEKKQEDQEKWKTLTVEEHMAWYEQQGMERKEAMKHVAKDRGVSKREIYKDLL